MQFHFQLSQSVSQGRMQMDRSNALLYRAYIQCVYIFFCVCICVFVVVLCSTVPLYHAKQPHCYTTQFLHGHNWNAVFGSYSWWIVFTLSNISCTHGHNHISFLFDRLYDHRIIYSRNINFFVCFYFFLFCSHNYLILSGIFLDFACCFFFI